MNTAFEDARAGGVIDTFLSIPASRAEKAKVYDYIREQTKDDESADHGDARGVHVQGRPEVRGAERPRLAEVLAEMDEHGIRKMLPGIHENKYAKQALHRAPRPVLRRHRRLDPNTGMEAVRKIVEFVRRGAIWRTCGEPG